MWNPLKASSSECDQFREWLEELAGGEAPPTALREHASACQNCRTAVDEVAASSELLRALPRQAAVGPWFAPRVMAAIVAQESELRRSVDTWIFLPKLARRLTWISALALVLTGTWFLGRPASTPVKPAATDMTGEPVVDTTPPVNNDDLLLSLAEKGS
jgi:predicted anti-sigma-YlaC factor YlaD